MPQRDKLGTKNRIQKERKTTKPFQKNSTEMSGTQLAPHRFVFVCPSDSKLDFVLILKLSKLE